MTNAMSICILSSFFCVWFDVNAVSDGVCFYFLLDSTLSVNLCMSLYEERALRVSLQVSIEGDTECLKRSN